MEKKETSGLIRPLETFFAAIIIYKCTAYIELFIGEN